MKDKFSASGRRQVLENMASRELELLVIGGGITGAGIALDASERGLDVGLLEKRDFASGTSSRSTKLVHGGLRYLKQGEVKLVMEVGRERAIAYRNAPHLVVPAPMLLPIYKGGTYGYWASSIGLYIYDLLAGVARQERRRMLGREETMRREPLLKREGLKGGGLYFEYRTDDARLTLDILKTAVARGARAANYAEVRQFIYRDGKAAGVRVYDRISGETCEIYAKQIVNAAGPWVDGVRKLDGSLQGKRLFLTKGVHLVIDSAKLPVSQSAYFDTPDGRMVFVIPRGKVTYVGTTDTAYELSVDEPRTTEQDRDYLLRAVNAMFPDVRLAPDDVRSHWAGLRPLIYEEGKGPSELSRKDEVLVSDSGLLTIAGGKLTGYRKMAEKIVDLVCRKLQAASGRSYPSCSTDRIVISGGETHGFPSYGQWAAELRRRGEALGVPGATMDDWIGLYGSNTLGVLERLERIRNEDYPGLVREKTEELLLAPLLYSVEEEMTVTAADYLRQRTGWTFFDFARAERESGRILAWMGALLNWSDQDRIREESRVQELLRSVRELPASDERLKRQQS